MLDENDAAKIAMMALMILITLAFVATGVVALSGCYLILSSIEQTIPKPYRVFAGVVVFLGFVGLWVRSGRKGRELSAKLQSKQSKSDD
jgi:zinc transporter ZupT